MLLLNQSTFLLLLLLLLLNVGSLQSVKVSTLAWGDLGEAPEPCVCHKVWQDLVGAGW